MTKQELIEELEKASKITFRGHIDPEAAHIKADELLLEYINDPEITEAFNKIERWYA
jgi:hypothetical protein